MQGRRLNSISWLPAHNYPSPARSRRSVRLKRQFQAILQLAGWERCNGLAELGAAHISDRIEEVDAIEKIESVHTKLNGEPLADFCVLYEGEIHVLEGRTAEDVAAQI